MRSNVSRLHGWGYQGRSADELVAYAALIEVDVVVDVRLNPISRKRGLSKRALRESLEVAGIGYLHLPELGNPRDNRAGFADPSGPGGRAAHERFRVEVLESSRARSAVNQIVARLADGPVLLLCYEADEECCHRRLVREAVGDVLDVALA